MYVCILPYDAEKYYHYQPRTHTPPTEIGIVRPSPVRIFDHWLKRIRTVYDAQTIRYSIAPTRVPPTRVYIYWIMQLRFNQTSFGYIKIFGYPYQLQDTMVNRTNRSNIPTAVEI